MAKDELQRAIEAEDVDGVRALLAARPDLAQRRLSRGSTYLAMAAGAADEAPELVALLLAAGAHPDAADELGITPLHCAIDANRPSEVGARVIELLVQAGADVEAHGQYGWTPLQYAVERGGLEEVEALLAAGARVNVTYPDASPAFARGKTLLRMAKGDARKIDALRRAGAQS